MSKKDISPVSLLSLHKEKYIITHGLTIVQKRIKTFLENFNRTLQNNISSDISIDFLSKHELTKELFSCCLLKVSEGYIAVVLDNQAIDIMITSFFGGKGHPKQKNSSITKLENIARIKWLMILIESINNTFLPIFNNKIIGDYKIVSTYNFTEQYNTFSFMLKLGKGQGIFNLVFPNDFIKSIYHHSSDSYGKVDENINEIELKMSASLNKKSISLGGVKGLSVGQVLNFGSDNISVVIDNKNIYQGKLGSIGNKRAIKVEKCYDY